jgi:hypothetical protein
MDTDSTTSVNPIKQRRSTMSTTTDDAPTILEDQPTERIPAEHPAPPVDAPPRPRRTALRWFGGGAVAVAAATLVAVLVIATETDTDRSVDTVIVIERSGDATELDVHGIPVSWSRRGGAPRQHDATELDIHGIPTWWSGRAPAP